MLNVSIDKTATLRAETHGHVPIVAGFKGNQGKDARGIGYEVEKSPTILAGQEPHVAIYDIAQRRDVLREYRDKTPTLTAFMGAGGNNVPILTENTPNKAYALDSLSSNSMKSKNPNSGCHETEIAKTLDTSTPDPSKNQGGIAIVQPSFCIAGNTIERQIQNGGNGKGVLEEVSYTLNTVDRHAVAQPSEQMSDTGGQIVYSSSKASFHTLFLKEKANTLVATDWKDAPTVTIVREEQRAAEDKSSEVSAPMTEEDSTDKM